MKRYYRSGAWLFMLIAIVMLGCKSRTGGAELKEEAKDDSWHMTDEIMHAQVGPAEEESFRLAAHDGDLETVKMLLKQGVGCDAVDEDGHTALMFAAFNGHSEIVIYLLDAGAVIDRRDYLDRTALLYCATGPFPETVKILLDRGAEPNVVDSDEHFSPLMHAASEGLLDVVKVLIAHGADTGLKDVDGDDAGSFAAQNGHTQVVDYLSSIQ